MPLAAYVREIGGVDNREDLNDQRSAEEDKQDQEKTSTTKPVMIVEGLHPLL